MTRSKARSLRTAFTATIVFVFAASLVACASLGPLTPVAVSDVKSVAGTWEGAVYQSGSSRTRSHYHPGGRLVRRRVPPTYGTSRVGPDRDQREGDSSYRARRGAARERCQVTPAATAS